LSELLLIRLKSGDKSALKELYDLHGLAVYNTALNYVQDVMIAEEITQDVFIEVYRSVSKFKGNAKISTWLYRICINKSLDSIRKKKAQKRSGGELSLNDPSNYEDIPHFEHPGFLLENQELGRYLFAALEKLPDRQKSAFILSHIENMSQKEISEVLETSIKSVESLIQRAKKNLREILKNYYEQRRK